MPTAEWMTGIDHPVIAVREMAAARAAFERLGFTIPPRGSHVEWGTGNWCIMFPRDYIELRGIVKAGHTHNLGEFLEMHGEGLMGLALGTQDAASSRQALLDRGFHPQEVRGLTRNFELPEGWVQPRFSLCFLDEDETAGLMSVVYCQHLTPELMRRPDWLAHANGARGVLRLTGVVPDVAAAAATHARLFGAAAVHRDGQRLTVKVGRGEIVLGAPKEILSRYPECSSSVDEGSSRLVALTLETQDLAATESLFQSRGVAFRRSEDGSIVVTPRAAHGVAIEFA